MKLYKFKKWYPCWNPWTRPNEQFDLRLRAVVARVGDEVDRRIVQVEAMSIMFALALIASAVFGTLSYLRYRRTEGLRRAETSRLRRDYLAEYFMDETLSVR